MNQEEYKKLKNKEMERAVARYEAIQKDPRKCVRYRDSRPITDLKNMIETSAAIYPDNVAFMQKFNRDEPYTKITYKEAMADINALGTALIAHGLQGKRISVCGENCYMWAISYLAIVGGVGVVVPLDKELSQGEMAQVLSDGGSEAILFTDKYEDRFISLRAEGKTKLATLVNMNAKENHGDVLSLWALIEEGKKLIVGGDRSYLDAQVVADDMSILLFTSGTTGISKGVMLSQSNICANLMIAPTLLEVRQTEVFFSVLPLHHTYACTDDFLMPLYKGACIAYCEGLKYILKNMEEAQPTFLLSVPLILESLHKKIWATVRKSGKEAALRKGMKINNALKKVGIDKSRSLFKDIHNVFGGNMRMFICGGAAINPDILQDFKDWGILALQGYGLTECSPIAALNPDKASRNASIGVMPPTTEGKIINPSDDGIGEICVKGDHVMLGYYNMPEATAEVIDSEGWYHTGDLGYADKEGYFYITGRKKNVIITKNGKNVFPEELEYYLSNVPYVAESMVWGAETEDGSDTLIVASVVPDWAELEPMLANAGFTGEINHEAPEVLKKVEEILWTEVDKINSDVPFFKKIKKVVVRTQEFEKNSSKKIKRFVESNRG